MVLWCTPVPPPQPELLKAMHRLGLSLEIPWLRPDLPRVEAVSKPGHCLEFPPEKIRSTQHSKRKPFHTSLQHVLTHP